MEQQPLEFERTYNAPVSKVWDAISNNEQMQKWYFKIPDFKAEPGFEFYFLGTGRDGEKFKHLCKVTEVIPEKKLSYTWSYEGLPGDSLVTFELFPEGDKTRLKLTHAGVESFSENGVSFTAGSFTEGWTAITGRMLKDFLESTEA